MGSIIARVSDADQFSAVLRPPQFFDPLSSRKFRQWFAHTSLFLRTMNCLAYAPSSVLLFVVCIMQNANESEPEFTSRVTAHDSTPNQILLLYSVKWQIPLNLMLLLFVFQASIFFVNASCFSIIVNIETGFCLSVIFNMHIFTCDARKHEKMAPH